MTDTLVQIGAGGRPIDGFVNIDTRPGASLTHGHAHDVEQYVDLEPLVAA